MVAVRFTDPKGKIIEAEAEVGDNLLRLAQALGLPLEGTCEGQMACSTCHVHVAPEDFAKLPPAREMEDDMLDLAADVNRYSRLACQVWLSEDLENLTVKIPGTVHNMQGR